MSKYNYEIFVDENKIATFYEMSDALVFIEACDTIYYKDDMWCYTIKRTEAPVQESVLQY